MKTQKDYSKFKHSIDGFVIVEGKSDVIKLKTFLNAEVIPVLGNVIPKKELLFMQKLNESYTSYIFTDNDEAGERIRKRLNENLKNTINLKVEVKESKNNKYGVAEASIESLIEIFKPYFSKPNNYIENVTLIDLYDMGLIGNTELLNNFKDKYSLGLAKGKELVRRINLLKITKNDIIQYVEKYGNQ